MLAVILIAVMAEFFSVQIAGRSRLKGGIDLNRIMHKVSRAALAAALTAVMAVPFSIQAAGMSSTDKMNLDKELSSMIGNDGTHVPAVGVIVYKDGAKVYAKAFGRRYIDSNDRSKDLPMNLDTRYRIASVSKQFTAFTIMQLVAQGKMDLDADVSKYLGFKLRNPNYPDTPITVRMLLGHTSSIRDGKIYSTPPTDSITEFFIPGGKYYENGDHFAPLGQEPGKYFKYTNLNYGLLGTIIEKITGERFDHYQRSHILKQLDIKGSYTVGDFNANEIKNVGVIYQKQKNNVWQEEGPWIAQMDDYRGKVQDPDMGLVTNPDFRSLDGWYSLKNYKPGTNATIFSPQGGLHISLNEMSHLLEMLLNRGYYKGKQIVKPELIDEMFKIQWRYDPVHPNGSNYGGSVEAYGLAEQPIFGNGTSRVVKDQEIDLQGHLGEAYGLLSGVQMRPKTKDGFVYISTGEAVAEDTDPRSAGNFSGNYVWEENIMQAICKNAFLSKN